MSDDANLTRPGSRIGKHKYVWLLLLPVLGLLVFAASWGLREWDAAQANRSEIDRLAAMGVPYNNATLEQAYRDRTHPEGTQDWVKSIELIQWGQQAEGFERLPHLGWDAEEPVNLVPGGNLDDWPDEPLVASYLEEMEPVIDLIERASSQPTPVRFPIKFQGIGTLLPHVQEARGIHRLLSLDCEYAFFKQDNQRAMRDLKLMQATVEAFDGRECLVSELVNVALRGIWMGALRRTLTHCQWSAADLEILRDSLASQEEILARWQDVMLHERAFGLSAVGESAEVLFQAAGLGSGQQSMRFSFFNGPAEVRTLMEVYQELIELPVGSDFSNWQERAEELEERVQRLPSNSLAGILAPAVSAVINAEIRVEETRRWTLTAIAIQQFKQQNEEVAEGTGRIGIRRLESRRLC